MLEEKIRHDENMSLFEEIIQSAFRVDTIWSIVLRGGIWLLISLVIIASVDSEGENFTGKKLKSTLGFFLMFLVLSSTLIYLLFGVGKS